MNSIDSSKGKVIAHIDDAKNWLDEAKEDYLQSNRIRGELNLNLAQAEVKYAWELSRQQNVKSDNQPALHKRGNYYWPAAAAILLVLCTAALFQFGVKPDRTNSTALTAKTKTLYGKDSKQPEAAPADKLPVSVANTTQTSNAEANSPMISQAKTRMDTGKKSGLAHHQVEIVKTEVIDGKKSIPKNTVVSEEAVTRKRVTPAVAPVSQSSVQIKESQETRIVLENSLELSERDTTQAQPQIQSQSKGNAISLIIDEEALTKEASYSLRNGK